MKHAIGWLIGLLVCLNGLLAQERHDPLDGAAIEVRSRDGTIGRYRLIAQAGPSPTGDSIPIVTPAQFRITFAGESAPMGVHVRANFETDAALIDGRYEWDFGDPAGAQNRLVGFNSAHVYDTPGEFTINLRVTDASGKITQSSAIVRVPENRRRAFYISAQGNDNNGGISPESPVRSWGRAKRALADGAQILFRRGDAFDVDSTLNVGDFDNVRIGSYGEGDLPTLRWIGTRNGSSMIASGRDGDHLVVENLRFDSIFTDDTEQTGMPVAFAPRGENITIRGCEFLNIGYAINSNAKPHGLLVSGNTAPSRTGMRGYFVWAAGEDLVIVGNTVANSTREHIVRASEAQRLAVVGNRFTNLGKSAIALQYSDVTTIAQNICSGKILENGAVTGAIRIGPLASGSKENNLPHRTRFVVVEENDAPEIGIEHGAAFVVVRHNIIRNAGKDAIQIDGYSTEWQRGVEDLKILSNTAINDNPNGRFLMLNGSAKRIEVRNNLYVAPNMIAGPYKTTVLYVQGDDLGSFSRIENNVWPNPRTSEYTQGGIHYLWKSWSDQQGFRTPEEWSNLSPVKGDVYENVTLDADGKPPVNSIATQLRAGARIP